MTWHRTLQEFTYSHEISRSSRASFESEVKELYLARPFLKYDFFAEFIFFCRSAEKVMPSEIAPEGSIVACVIRFVLN